MSMKIRRSHEAKGEPRVVADFLPSPAQLADREEEVKITIALSRASVAFFKAEAERLKTPYQRMIRRLLDAYMAAHPAP